MINGYTEQFLDTGWYSESTLFYNGCIYWHEAQTNDTETVFFVDCWKAENEGNLYFHSSLEPNGTLPFKRVLEIHGTDLELIKKQFLESPVYDGKTFREVEKELAWLDER
jgi:hypothetical protein